MKAQCTSKVSCSLLLYPNNVFFSSSLARTLVSTLLLPLCIPIQASSFQGFSVRIGAPKHVWWGEGGARIFARSPSKNPLPPRTHNPTAAAIMGWRGHFRRKRKGGIFVRDPKDSFSMATTVYHHQCYPFPSSLSVIFCLAAVINDACDEEGEGEVVLVGVGCCGCEDVFLFPFPPFPHPLPSFFLHVTPMGSANDHHRRHRGLPLPPPLFPAFSKEASSPSSSSSLPPSVFVHMYPHLTSSAELLSPPPSLACCAVTHSRVHLILSFPSLSLLFP